MANGTYGTKRPAQITSKDIDIFYHYRPSRSSDSASFSEFKQLSSDLLYSVDAEYTQQGSISLPGMYNLRLPLDVFGESGIYTIYIKPKEVFTRIVDADSRLAAYSDIRGIVLDATTVQDAEMMNNGNLVGYRVEYFDPDDDTLRMDDFKIVTSNNRCEPVMQNFNDSSQKGVRYRFNDSSNLVFCTLSPSTSLPFKANSLPGIGLTNQMIALVNTKFNPVVLEIEMTSHDMETIANMLEGTQLRNLDTGTITTFNKDGGVYHQASYGNIVNPSENMHYDFKIEKTNNIDFGEETKLRKIKEHLRTNE